MPYTRSLLEEKFYCEGVRASDAGDLQNTNPYDQTTQPIEFAQWDQGWVDHNAANADHSRCAVPRPGSQSAEIVNAPRY